MSNDDEMDALLDAMERRAGRLKDESTSRLRETDAFGHTGLVKAAKQSPLPRPGDAIGENYEVVKLLGQGEDSHVLLVRHRGVDRTFAMKLLPQALARDESSVARFQDEARAASKIGHENIVFVTDFGKSNQFGFFYVMEYLDGEPLSAWLERDGKLPREEVLNLALCTGSALAAAHDLGVVHRDVRPENLMSHRGESNAVVWKLLDFGLSTPVMPEHADLSLYREPLYVAPELAAGLDTDARADQFSLCAVLYHCFTGHPPWPKRRWTTAVPDEWTPPKLTTNDATTMSVGIRLALMRGLSCSPEDRFDSVEDLLSKLQRGSSRSRQPSVPPIDLQEAARALSGQAANASVTIGTTFESEVSEVSEAEQDAEPKDEFHDPPSVEISLDLLPNARPKITMVFQSAARLRREWLRNLVTGGLFVPTERHLAPKTPCMVTLRFEPTEAEATFPASVLGPAPQGSATRGLAVQINESLQDTLQQFLRELDLGLLAPYSLVRPLRSLTKDSEVTADEAFLLDRVRGPIRLGELRGMFQSLPLDLDDLIAGLVDKGLLAVDGTEKPSRRPSNVPSETTARNEFVRLTLQRADFFRQQGNFMAEIETLKLATDRYPEPELYYRIGLSKVQFLNDADGAVESLQQAVQLAPGEKKYEQALREAQNLLR